MRTIAWIVAAFLILLVHACVSQRQGPPDPEHEPPPANATATVILAFLEGFSGGALETIGTDLVLKQRDGATIVSLFDKHGPGGSGPPDGRLQLEELRAWVTASTPEELAGKVTFLTTMGWALYEARRSG